MPRPVWNASVPIQHCQERESDWVGSCSSATPLWPGLCSADAPVEVLASEQGKQILEKREEATMQQVLSPPALLINVYVFKI